MRICIDPGHGGSDSGAVGLAGTKEKDIALAVGLMVRDLLKSKHQVIMTRDTDVFVPLYERSALANTLQVHAFISIHCNGFFKPSAHGWEIYTSPGQTQADPLATSIYNKYKQLKPDAKIRADWSDGDVDKEAEFHVLVRTKMPAVLVEMGFITHPESELWLIDPKNQFLQAKAVVLGLDCWKK